MIAHNIHFHEKHVSKTSLNVCFLDLSEEFRRDLIDCVWVYRHVNTCGPFCVVSKRKGEKDRRDSR